MARSIAAVDHCVEVECAIALVDYWRAGDSDGIDVAASSFERATGGPRRLCETVFRDGVEGHNRVVFCRDDHESPRRARRVPVQRLRIDVAWHAPVERRIAPHIGDVRPGQAGHDIMPAAGGVSVIGRHRCVGPC